MTAWYAVYTQARMEKWARSNLWERDLEVYLPLYSKQRRHARRVDTVTAPLFPRYLFVRADLARTGRRAIASAPGVSELVSFGNRPAVVDDAIIAEIRSRQDDSGNVIMCEPSPLKAGERVRVQMGALRDTVGLFQQMADDQRGIILLDLMGRSVRVKAPVDAIARDS